MAIYITTVDGHRERVHSDTDDDTELTSLLRRSGWPYDHGWVRVERQQPLYVALAQVARVELMGEPHAGR